MTLDENLKLERYKLVTDRQKYFTELARESFSFYMKMLTGLVAGSITLISLKSTLELRIPLLSKILCLVAALITFLGIVSIFQIIFCLARWKGYRQAEIQIYKESPPIKWWYWVFETLYCVAIIISIASVWFAIYCLISFIEFSVIQIPT